MRAATSHARRAPQAVHAPGSEHTVLSADAGKSPEEISAEFCQAGLTRPGGVKGLKPQIDARTVRHILSNWANGRRLKCGIARRLVLACSSDAVDSGPAFDGDDPQAIRELERLLQSRFADQVKAAEEGTESPARRPDDAVSSVPEIATGADLRPAEPKPTKYNLSEVDYDAIVLSLRRAGKGFSAALVEHMKSREEMKFDDVKDKVHGNKHVTDNAVRKNVSVTNRALAGMHSPLEFFCRNGSVFKRLRWPTPG